MKNFFNTTVTELHSIFRESLVALIPSMERAKICWSDSTAYDDWDNIATCLYENIVINSFRFASEASQDILLPNYDLVAKDYKNDFILVEGPDVPEFAAFIGFGARASNFESIKWVKILPSGEVPEQKLGYSLYNEAYKFYLIRKETSGIKKVDKLTVEL